MAPLVSIPTHTTSSKPRPHILYCIHISKDGGTTIVPRRYSEFVALHETLKDRFILPPKRLLETALIPSAWVDDALIAERKFGLEKYLTALLSSPDFEDSSILAKFLTPNTAANATKFNLEDALPSTFARKTSTEILVNVESATEVGAQAKPIAAAYYPDWCADSNPPEKIDFSKFDILFFAFATPNSSSTLAWDSGSQSILKRLVAAKRSSGKSTKIVLSVGGWAGCRWFSQACSNSSNRSTFVNAIASAINQYGIDGVDLDWEYPNSEGAGNPHSSADAGNLLKLVQALRKALPSPKIISAAVPHLPWLGTNGKPLTDVSEYAKVMDYVNIMNYDVWSSSATPGPNAPLGDLCGTSKQPQASAQAALAQWKKAGFPPSQQLLGLPLYGYVSKSTMTRLTGSLMPNSDMVLLVKNEEAASLDGAEPSMTFVNGTHVRNKPVAQENMQVTGQAQAAAANLQKWWGQQIPFNEIVKSGALVKKSDGSYGEGGGFTMAWDNCSDTPFLYNTGQKTVVTYDDTWSIASKTQFAKSSGMAGCFTWSLDQDDGVTLHNVICKSLGR